jgi:hypothetical protein
MAVLAATDVKRKEKEIKACHGQQSSLLVELLGWPALLHRFVPE